MAGFWDFINNYRSSAMKAAADSNLTQPRTKADEILTVPSPIVRPVFKSPGKGYQQVHGFEQDKDNYGDERDASKLDWFSYTANNNDTGDKMTFEVGYDEDGKINGIRQWEGPAQKSYFGKELVKDFFKNNFDRDATDYTIYSSRPSWDGSRDVWFDSKSDGEFIPSISLGRLAPPRSAFLNFDSTDKPNSPTAYDQFKEQDLQSGTIRNTIDVDDYLGDIPEPAYNSTLEPQDMRAYTPKTERDWNRFGRSIGIFLQDMKDIDDTAEEKQGAKIGAAKFNYSGIRPLQMILLDIERNIPSDHEKAYGYAKRMINTILDTKYRKS